MQNPALMLSLARAFGSRSNRHLDVSTFNPKTVAKFEKFQNTAKLFISLITDLVLPRWLSQTSRQLLPVISAITGATVVINIIDIILIILIIIVLVVIAIIVAVVLVLAGLIIAKIIRTVIDKKQSLK